jgi:hypothetical protein
MSKHPGVKAGPFEIRPVADLSEMICESEWRRARLRGESQRSSADSKGIVEGFNSQ